MSEEEERAAKRVALVCPYDGGALWVSTRSEGPAFMTYDVPDEIECQSCRASWLPDGSPTLAAEWIEWPGLYEVRTNASRDRPV